jgi:antitoxin HicB
LTRLRLPLRGRRATSICTVAVGGRRQALGQTSKTMASERSYAVVLEPEPEGGYSVHIPAFRGAHTQGETVEECLANAREVIELHAEVMAERGEPLPPSDVVATVAVTLPSPAA